MRLLLFFISFLSTTATFGQKETFDNADSIVCTLPVNYMTIVNDKPITPFISAGNYLGKVIIQAQIDTLTMKLTRHKIIYADLHSKSDPNKEIQVRLNDRSGDIKYLDMMFPDLIKHLQYLKFKIVEHNNCVITTSWKFPITIK